MMGKFEVMCFNKSIENMKAAVEQGDNYKIFISAYMLKGASVYIGAGRLHLICTNMEFFYRKDEFEKLIDWYPLFIESCIETKRWNKSYLAS